MKILFSQRKLKKQCETERQLRKAFGDRSDKLKLRLGVLKNAPSLDDVPKGSPDWCHELSNDRAGQFAVTIKDNWRIIFVPDHEPIPLKADGGIELCAITAIRIIEIGDYH